MTDNVAAGIGESNATVEATVGCILRKTMGDVAATGIFDNPYRATLENTTGETELTV